MIEGYVKKRIEDYARSSLQKIEVLPGVCRFNYCCMYNAVHDAINEKEEAVAMVFYINDGWPLLHFISVNKKGQYIDNTLGQWCQRYDYYLIRKISKEEYWEIGAIFENYKKVLRVQLLSWWMRLLCGYGG